MAKLLNADYWKKAYLLEFKMNHVLTDAFTFSVPPESEEFSFPQRKSETKTFGGAVVADYGNDLVNINLSGSTINQELKLIYKSSFGSETMTGEKEIFYLRDLLRKYGSRDKLQGKEVYLYSLNGGGNVSSNPKWWKIYVGQLDISRSKDKPFCYNYKFSATGAPEVVSQNSNETNRKFKWIGGKIDQFKDYMTGENGIVTLLNKGAYAFEELGANYLGELSEYLGTLHSCIDAFNMAVDQYSAILTGDINEAAGMTIDTISLGEKVLSTSKRFYPSTLVANVYNSCLNMVGAAKAVYNYCANIDTSQFTESSWQNVKELFDDTVSNTDIADAYSSLAYKEKNYANQAAVITSKYLNDSGFAIIPGEQDEDDKLVMSYGYKVVSITDSETSWDQLAQDYYGDSTLSYIIATYNNLQSDQPLKAGQSILIPNLNFAESKTAENEIYNSPDVKDNYGNDIQIKDKDFGVYNGDIALINGVKNLEQALLNRYSTLIGARIRVEAYGIQASIGDALNATSALIQASVHQTTVEDPRVDSVEDISFKGKRDSLTVTVIYIDKNGAKRNFGGTI